MSGDQGDTSIKTFKDTLDDSMFESLGSVKFGFLKFGSLCNASESNAFTSARCEINNIINEERKHYTIDFETLFKLGLDLLKKWKLENHPCLDERNTRAINILKEFIEKKGKGFLYANNFFDDEIKPQELQMHCILLVIKKSNMFINSKMQSKK